MTITPTYLPLTVYQGAIFNPYIGLLNPDGTLINLAGKSLHLQAREAYYSLDTFIDISTANGGILTGTFPVVINGVTVDFNVQLLIPASVTSILAIQSGVYDLKLTDTTPTPPDIERLIYGPLCVSFEVTQ